MTLVEIYLLVAAILGPIFKITKNGRKQILAEYLFIFLWPIAVPVFIILVLWKAAR